MSRRFEKKNISTFTFVLCDKNNEIIIVIIIKININIFYNFIVDHFHLCHRQLFIKNIYFSLKK